MNPARAWLLLTTRSTGVEITPGGFGSLKPADVAGALQGLERGRFLLGMAVLAGDRDVLAELHSYITVDVVIRAEREHWECERGAQTCRSLSALALFELLNGTRCHVCGGRGTVDPEYLRLARMSADERKEALAIARLESQGLLADLREKRYERARIEAAIRKARRKATTAEVRELRAIGATIDELEHATSAIRESVPCRRCRASGIHVLTSAERAGLVECSRSSWYRHWDERYAGIADGLQGWVSACLRHVRRRMSDRAA